MTAYNSTVAIAGLSNAASMLPPGVVFVLVAIALALISFMLFKFFRYFIYGLVIIIPTGLIFFISLTVTRQYTEGNAIPFYAIIGSLAVICISVLLGYLLSKTKMVKKIEKRMK